MVKGWTDGDFQFGSTWNEQEYTSPFSTKDSAAHALLASLCGVPSSAPSTFG
jgi:hypothetical protein